MSSSVLSGAEMQHGGRLANQARWEAAQSMASAAAQPTGQTERAEISQLPAELTTAVPASTAARSGQIPTRGALPERSFFSRASIGRAPQTVIRPAHPHASSGQLHNIGPLHMEMTAKPPLPFALGLCKASAGGSSGLPGTGLASLDTPLPASFFSTTMAEQSGHTTSTVTLSTQGQAIDKLAPAKHLLDQDSTQDDGAPDYLHAVNLFLACQVLGIIHDPATDGPQHRPRHPMDVPLADALINEGLCVWQQRYGRAHGTATDVMCAVLQHVRQQPSGSNTATTVAMHQQRPGTSLRQDVQQCVMDSAASTAAGKTSLQQHTELLAALVLLGHTGLQLPLLPPHEDQATTNLTYLSYVWAWSCVVGQAEGIRLQNSSAEVCHIVMELTQALNELILPAQSGRSAIRQMLGMLRQPLSLLFLPLRGHQPDNTPYMSLRLAATACQLQVDVQRAQGTAAGLELLYRVCRDGFLVSTTDTSVGQLLHTAEGVVRPQLSVWYNGVRISVMAELTSLLQADSSTPFILDAARWGWLSDCWHPASQSTTTPFAITAVGIINGINHSLQEGETMPDICKQLQAHVAKYHDALHPPLVL